jgi:predicted transcriptional regulator
MRADQKILKILAENKEGMTTREVAAISGIKKINTVRGTIKKLMNQGLIEKGPKRDCYVDGYWSHVYHAKNEKDQ